MKTLIKPLLNVSLFVVICLLCSCAADEANRYYLSAHYPPKNVKDVEVLSSNPLRPFEVIADFQSRGESTEAIRKKAAKIGADAVIVTTLGGYYANNNAWVGDERSSKENTYSRIVGTAIKYK